MNTLTRFAVPIALAASLVATAANAHPDRSDDRNGYGDRRVEFRYDNRADRYTHARDYFSRYSYGERERFRRLTTLARDNRKYRKELERERRKLRRAWERDYDRYLKERRRHGYDRNRWDVGYRYPVNHDRYRRSDDDFWSIVLDVAFAY